MPLIFIALFLGSFLIGAGTGYVTQGQGGFGGTPPVSQGTPTPYATPDARTACFPKVYQPIVKLETNEIVVEARQFVDQPPVQCDDSELPGNVDICCKDKPPNFTCDVDDNDDGNPEEVYQQDKYQKILDHLFGKDAQIEGQGTPNEFNPNRTTHSYILVKKDAWMPSWKIAYSSGGATWRVPMCWWNGTTCPAGEIPDDQRKSVVFREATRIGHLNVPNLSNEYLKDRYKGYPNGPGDVWVATGWCPAEGPPGGTEGGETVQYDCSDPLIRNVILVVHIKGKGPQSGRGSRDKTARITVESSNPLDTWWSFDVYYDAAILEQRAAARSSTPTNEDLPCWMRLVCGVNDVDINPAGRNGKSDLPCSQITPAVTAYPGAFKINPLPNPLSILKNSINKILTKLKPLQNVSAETTVQFPQFVSGKSITYTNPSDPRLDKIKLNTYFIAAPTTLPTGTEKIGYVTGTGGNNFDIHAVTVDLVAPTPTTPPTPTPNEYVGLQTIYLVDNTGQVRQYLFVHRESGQGETLKLRTFYPPIIELDEPPPPSHFAYEWYTPSCKPAIYLYPEKETVLSVFVKPEGRLTESIPVYNAGWENVLAKPDGTLVYKGLSLPYLYYEAEVKNVNAPSQGWVVKKEDLPGFFNTTLPYLGLNSTEITDFKNYWLKKLTDKPYYFAGLIDRKILDEKEKIEFSIKPDQFIRVRFYFSGLDKPIIAAPPLLSKTPQRDGFTAVDWGGIIAGGTCSSEDTQIVQ